MAKPMKKGSNSKKGSPLLSFIRRACNQRRHTPTPVPAHNSLNNSLNNSAYNSLHTHPIPYRNFSPITY